MPTPPLPRLRDDLHPVDRLHLAFYGFVVAVSLVRFPALPRPWAALGWYGGALLATLALARLLRGRVGWGAAWPRILFTLALEPLSFVMLVFVVPWANPFHAERLLYDLDTAMFLGRNPNVMLDRWTWPPLTELLQFVYTTYYAIPLVLLLVIVTAGKRDRAGECLFLVLLCLLASYVGYFVLTASGPNVNRLGLFPPHFSDPMPGLWFAEDLRRATYDAEWFKEDCWPSGHTALSVVCLAITRRERTRVGFWLLVFPVVALVFSTVYLRYHYVFDVLCGLALAWAVMRWGPGLYLRYAGGGSHATLPPGRK